MGQRKEITEQALENEAKARDFMAWYGANMGKLRRYLLGGALGYDEDLFTDAFLRVYDAIARRGTVVKDNTGYFLRAYRSVFLDGKRRSGLDTVDGRALKTPSASEVDGDDDDSDGECALENLPASDINGGAYEEAVETVAAEVMYHVRESYDEEAVSLFEIYTGLSPDISYRRMSKMLGVSAGRIRPVMGRIKKDVVKKFGGRRHFLLSDAIDL